MTQSASIFREARFRDSDSLIEAHWDGLNGTHLADMPGVMTA